MVSWFCRTCVCVHLDTLQIFYWECLHKFIWVVDITSSKKTTIKHAHRMIEKILLTGVFIEPRTLGSALAFPYKMHQPKIRSGSDLVLSAWQSVLFFRSGTSSKLKYLLLYAMYQNITSTESILCIQFTIAVAVLISSVWRPFFTKLEK